MNLVMIQSKADLKEYLYADKVALGKAMKKHPGVLDLIWKYEISLRYCEYYKNIRGGISHVYHKYITELDINC